MREETDFVRIHLSRHKPKLIREETDFVRIHLADTQTKHNQRRDGFCQNPSRKHAAQKQSEKRRILSESISQTRKPNTIREETDFVRIHLANTQPKSNQRRDGFCQNPSRRHANQTQSEKRRILSESISETHKPKAIREEADFVRIHLSRHKPKVIREETDFVRIHLADTQTKENQRRDGFCQNPSLQTQTKSNQR